MEATQYVPKRQSKPNYYQNTFGPKIEEGSSYRNDAHQSVYQNSYKHYDILHGYDKIPYGVHPTSKDTKRRWSRNNIVLTMEHFEPISSTSTAKRYSNQIDYSYAYYEPGAAMRHSHIPNTPATNTQSGPSTRPKSIRSLLSKHQNDKMDPRHRHTYTTRYGTQENIYESVPSVRTRSDPESSNEPLKTESGSNVDFQEILHNHYRVLGQLNLSVEELLMPPATKTNTLPKSKNSRTNRCIIKSKSNFPSSMHQLLVGEDSGFSGSSSSASCAGSLRNYKTAPTRSQCNSPEVDAVDDSNTSDSTIDVHIPNEPKKIFHQMNSHLKGLKFPFRSKR